jgi:hypothetical protein
LFRPLARFTVNYLCFLQASVGINWRNDHAAKYSGFLSAADRAIFENNRAHLSFGDGASGDLASVFFFFPSFLDLEDQYQPEDYYTLISTAFRSGDWRAFESRYAAPLAKARAFYSDQYLNASIAAERLRTLAPNVEALAGVVLRNANRYRDEIWCADQPMLERVAQKIPTLWEDDIFGRWEAITGVKYPWSDYKILLVAAMKNGPNANSLACDANTFYADDSPESYDYYRCFLSHEVGTHLLAPITVMSYSGSFFNLAYAVQENLARFYNLRLYPQLRYSLGEDFYHTDSFDALFRALAGGHPEAGPVTLFELVLERAIRDFPTG